MGEWIANHFTKDDKVGHVASINNQAEHDFLVDYVDKNAHRVAFDKQYGRVDAYNVGDSFYGKAMIGLNDFQEEGKWVWSSGEEVDFTKWRDGIRNRTYENVAVINAARSLSGVKNNNFGTWETIRNDDWRYRGCMMIL